MFKSIFKKEQHNIWVWLTCPDGLKESLGFYIPEELTGFLEFINKYSGMKGYSIHCHITNTEEQLSYLQDLIKKEKEGAPR